MLLTRDAIPNVGALCFRKFKWQLNTKGACWAIAACAVFLVGKSPTVLAQESHRFKTEAEKFKKIQEILRANDFVENEKQSRICSTLWLALQSDKREVTPIEPVMRIDSIDDPRLEKWNACPDKVIETPLKSTEYEHLFQGLLVSGGNPPYRIYQLDLDRNRKNGLEEVIYHEFDSISGHTGYSWVNTQRCTIETYVSAQNWSFSDKPLLPERYRLNMLVQYKNEPIVLSVFDAHITEGGSPAYIANATWFRNQEKFPGYCSWIPSTFVSSKKAQ